MKAARPTMPQEIRDLIRADVTQATDAHLLSMILGSGCTVKRVGRASKRCSCVELGSVVLELIGGGWPELVDQVAAGTADLYSVSFSLPMGARLMASVEISLRSRRGFKGPDRTTIRKGAAKTLLRSTHERRDQASATELVAVILGGAEPERGLASTLLEAAGGARRLVEAVSLADFESFRIKSRLHIRLTGSKVEIEFRSACRLLAANELARRYRMVKGPVLPALAPGTFGLRTPLLVELLDPGSDAPEELRATTLDALRSHPEMASDFSKLDRLAKDAGTEDLPRAVELGLMFELLRQDTEGRRPAEILGESAPFDALLALAEARIERAAKPPKRVLEIKARLERTSRALPEAPIDRFVAALATLDLPPAVADEAFAEARRRYLELAGLRDRASSA